MSLWTFKVLCYLKRHKTLLMGVILIILAVVGVSIYNSHQVEKPVLLKQEQIKDPVKLANAIHITKDEARQVISIKERTQPVATYYTQAPTVEQAAENVKKDIAHSNPNLPKAATEKTDRTAVVANTDKQKVDVYKINLNKAHKIKAGVTVLDSKAYETIGYQAGKVEVLAHFDGQHFEGGSVLYTVKEW